MQLKRLRPIAETLSAVTAVLVGASPASSAGLNRSETSLLIYSESNRVRATEGMFSVEKQLQSGYTLDLRLTFDGLTGASPTGASPSKQAQTVTRSSGGGRVVLAAGELPTDNGFGETRFAVDAGLSRSVSFGTNLSGGIHLSSEHDYKSLGLSGGLTKNLDSTRTTLGLGLSALRDVSSPLNGVPTPFESVNAEVNEDQNGRRITNGSKHKNVFDASLSLTRVLGSNLIARLSYNLEYGRGYLTDPYKIISLVQPLGSEDPGEPADAIYEKRPESRSSSAVACELRTYILGLLTETEYRYFWDDWGVRSHTAYLSLKLDLHSVGAFRPHVRWYHQDRANFSRPFLLQGAALPEFASSDSRLAKFDALTSGFAYTVPTSPQSQLTFSLEWYTQRGDSSPPESFGPLLAFNLFPDLDAVMLRVGLLHDF